MNKKTYNNLLALARAARGKIKMLYLHWTAGQHITNHIERADYHICILGDGRIEIECDDLTELRTHTWQRNTGGVGIALFILSDRLLTIMVMTLILARIRLLQNR